MRYSSTHPPKKNSGPSEVPYDALVAIFLGFASAVVDNVPLVAAAQGMSLGCKSALLRVAKQEFYFIWGNLYTAILAGASCPSTEV